MDAPIANHDPIQRKSSWKSTYREGKGEKMCASHVEVCRKYALRSLFFPRTKSSTTNCRPPDEEVTGVKP